MPPTAEPVRAAGAVVWVPGPLVAVVHRPRYDDWSLPKGKLDAGEHPLQAAVREVREETGVRGVVGRALGTSRYEVLDDGEVRPKTVQWWSLQALQGQFVPGEEVDALRWLPPDDARALLTQDRDGDVLEAFSAAPAALPLRVVVRHASAGRRAAGGDDDDRPLDARGQEQADLLRTLLDLHDVRRLVSAPPLRCRQTLEALARRTALPVEVHDVLGDAGQARDPDGARALVRGFADGTVVCTQGDAAPALLAALGATPSRLRKGSARLLHGDVDALVADDLLDPEERPAPRER